MDEAVKVDRMRVRNREVWKSVRDGSYQVVHDPGPFETSFPVGCCFLAAEFRVMLVNGFLNEGVVVEVMAPGKRKVGLYRVMGTRLEGLEGWGQD